MPELGQSVTWQGISEFSLLQSLDKLSGDANFYLHNKITKPSFIENGITVLDMCIYNVILQFRVRVRYIYKCIVCMNFYCLCHNDWTSPPWKLIQWIILHRRVHGGKVLLTGGDFITLTNEYSSFCCNQKVIGSVQHLVMNSTDDWSYSWNDP